jgi:hypothetical protein
MGWKAVMPTESEIALDRARVRGADGRHERVVIAGFIDAMRHHEEIGDAVAAWPGDPASATPPEG